MSEAETKDNSGLAEYDAGVVQLGDTELNGVPDEQIIEQYDAEEVDAVVYHGDASKKEGQDIGTVEHEEYLDQLEDTYESLNRIGEELDVDVLTLPGNHAPIEGNHDDDEEYVAEVEEMIEDEYDDFSDFEGNAYEFFVESGSEDVENENIVDFSGSVYETEGGVSLVGLGSHMEPELDKEVYGLLNADPDMEDFDYGEDILEEAADEMSEEPGFEYGLLSDIPVVGNWIETVGDKVADLLNYGAENVDPEDVNLADLEGLGEEFMTEEHQQYLEDLEKVKESEKYEQFVEKKEKVEELIESAEGEVAVFNHSTPLSEENENGSMVMTDVADEDGEEIEMIGGGHDHSSGVYDIGGTTVVNAAKTYTEIGFGDELHTEQYGIGSSGAEVRTGGTSPSPEQIMRDFRTVKMVEQAGGPEEFLSEVEDEVPEEQIEEVQEDIGELWENREQIENQAQQLQAKAEPEEAEA